MSGRAAPEGCWTAALPMYDLPDLRAATDAWWSGIARHLRAAGVRGVPDELTRPRALAEVWDDPDLLLGQGCGYPFTHAYADRWHYLATPVYAVPGCDGPAYRSWLVVAETSPVTAVADLFGATAAVNSADSHSGWVALRAALSEHLPMGHTPSDGGALGRVVWTGGHRAGRRRRGCR